MVAARSNSIRRTWLIKSNGYHSFFSLLAGIYKEAIPFPSLRSLFFHTVGVGIESGHELVGSRCLLNILTLFAKVHNTPLRFIDAHIPMYVYHLNLMRP